MIKSMTGFASLTRDTDHAQLTMTVKSVNHRYLDVQIRAPHALSEIEQSLRGLVQQYAARGRIELTVNRHLKAQPSVELELNEKLMTLLGKTATKVQADGLVDRGLTAGDLLRFPQVVTVREQPADEETWEAVREDVAAATEQALTELDQMRRREGEFLRRDLEERRAALGVLVDGIVAEAEAGDAALRERLLTRIAEIEASVDVDPAAIAQEVVRWSARSDTHEEVSRLRGHLEHMTQLSDETAPCGRKLDFLVQEMNREVNTIGSKAEGRGMAHLVVAAKAEIEKMREQIQNVE
jgi:uncharacterized protein (TIGR00255 family)